MRPKRNLPLTAAYLLLTSWAVPACAATAQALFAVQINLNSPVPSGYCINQTLSQSTQAIVTVVCGNNQFVSMDPQPGNPFLGTNGGAYRFMFEPSALISPDDPLGYIGAGTITTMHVFHAEGQNDTMELLVSF